MNFIKLGLVLVVVPVAALATGCGSDRNGGHRTTRDDFSLSPVARECYEAYHALRPKSFADGDLGGMLSQVPAPHWLQVYPVTDRHASGGRHVELQYLYKGLPLCGKKSTWHLLTGGDSHITSPLTDPEILNLKEPNRDLAFPSAYDVAEHALTMRGWHPDFHWGDVQPCVFVDEGQIVGGYELHLVHRRGAIYIEGNERRVLRFEDQRLEATAQIYPENPLGEIVEVPLAGVDGHKLKNSRFVVEVPEGRPQALGRGGRFHFDPASDEFAQVNVFAHAEHMLDWLTQPKIGYQLQCAPIELMVHQTFYDSPNNAEYLAPDFHRDGVARIRLGDGDGVILQNLALDFDVVAHEFSHHVFFRKLKAKSGHSGVIHEGLADYLAFAKTGNACLGESICPEESEICAVPRMCLRTADNELKYGTSEYFAIGRPHVRSQFLSGMLWDLGSELGQDTVAALTIKAIDYFQREMTFGDLVTALLWADREDYEGAHRCQILAHADRRGLAEFLSDTDDCL